jgi:hypothetical protein
LCPQTPGNHFDSRIFVRCSSIWWCSKDSRFPVIYGVRRQDFWAIASLCDAFQAPKPLSLQLQPFGKSDDDLGELTFEVGLFFCSVRASRTVHGVQADGPRRTSSSGVLRVLARLSFRSVSFLSFGWTEFRTVRGCLADSPRAPHGRSVFLGSLLLVLFALTDGPRLRPDSPRQGCGQSAVPCWTVRAAHRGRSALPGRTVRQIL